MRNRDLGEINWALSLQLIVQLVVPLLVLISDFKNLFLGLLLEKELLHNWFEKIGDCLFLLLSILNRMTSMMPN